MPQKKRGLSVNGPLVAALLLACGLINSPAAAHVVDSNPGRTRLTINDSWRYAPGNIPGAAAVDFDDGSWERVDLPHTWNAQDAFDKEPGYRRGTGWYRKHLSSVDVAPGRRHFV
ncbi:MAG: hypothetical protein WBW88_19470, partial [Rhodothermales bacterium]